MKQGIFQEKQTEYKKNAEKKRKQSVDSGRQLC